MRIGDAAVVMTSQHLLEEKQVKQERLTVWSGDSGPGLPAKDGGTGPGSLPVDRLVLSDQAKMAAGQQPPVTGGVAGEGLVVFEISEADKQKLRLLEKLFSVLLGKKIKFKVPAFKLRQERGQDIPRVDQPGTSQPARQGWGLVYDSRETYRETEKMSFSAQGSVVTTDGRRHNFAVELQVGREFFQEKRINIRAGDAQLIDPLAINFGGGPAGLSKEKYWFDLDADGKEDQISFLTRGSGFLAVDWNEDGVINDGRELFGPASGDGFAELAAYDADGNNWLDENDPIYERLRIWTKDDAGNDVLFALGQKGIGAIYLGNIAAEFHLKNEANELLGLARKAGIFLRENGTAGTVQEIDLVV
ncbi:MAG: hypothetical protein PHC60_07110 [Heliobacteriaceae bacterium]|nr:hypothetical protein [Heliobacteriaceae bacterium]